MPLIGIVAGEASGDLLGSHLIRALKQHRPDLEFVGIAGPKMMGEGAKSLFPMERLSVRGYVEVLRHLPGLLKLRKQLIRYFVKNPPDVFIGIDAPDFNFVVERKLKRRGIKTIHYVSPSIWAWRKGRMGKIRNAVSHMLALFPFEPALYQQADVPVTYVGHPLADILPLEPDTSAARDHLKIKPNTLVVAMLPGSRQSEVKQLADLFVKTAQKIAEVYPEVEILVPLITRETRDIFEQAMYDNLAKTESQPDYNQSKHDSKTKRDSKTRDDNQIKHDSQSSHEAPTKTEEFDQPATLPLPIRILFGHAHMAMEAADVVIVASGTATLEAALIKRPMVITYRMPWLSWQILKRMNYLPYVGLPNVLAGRFVVPELLQKDANPDKLAATTLQLISDKALLEDIQLEFARIHGSLRQNTNEKAAQVVLSYLR